MSHVTYSSAKVRSRLAINNLTIEGLSLYLSASVATLQLYLESKETSAQIEPFNLAA